MQIYNKYMEYTPIRFPIEVKKKYKVDERVWKYVEK